MSGPLEETKKVRKNKLKIIKPTIFNLQKESDFTIVVLGKGTVGKTSLIFKYIKNTCPGEHDPTVEDYYSTQIKMPSGEERIFKILDTAGEDDYQTMIDEWIKTANGFLLVFAINDKDSFEALKVKLKRINKNIKVIYHVFQQEINVIWKVKEKLINKMRWIQLNPWGQNILKLVL